MKKLYIVRAPLLSKSIRPVATPGLPSSPLLLDPALHLQLIQNVDILLVLLLCRGRQVVVALAAESLQIVVCKVSNVAGHNVQILKGLGLGVNDLVQELALDLVGRDRPPVEVLVEETSHGFQDGLGDVDVTALLVDLLVDHAGNLRELVLLGTVQLKGLRGRRVVVQHLLQGRTNVNGVNRPELLLPVVGSKEVQDTGQLEEDVVLETKDGRRSDNCRLREDVPGNLLTTSLGSVELGRGVGVGAVGGNVDEAINVVLRHRFRDPLGSLDMDVLQSEVLGRVIAADQVVNNVGMADASFDRVRVAQVVLHKNDPA